MESAENCTAPVTSKPFAPWGDNAHYQLAPGGAFEAGDAVVAAQQRRVGRVRQRAVEGDGASDSRSLQLNPGESATSPVMCVGLEHPTLRLFATNNRALLSTLSVEVIFETSLGLKAHRPRSACILPSGQWKPSPRFLVVANLLPLLPGEKTPVQFRMRSVGLGTWWVDDFYVDPKCR